MVKQVEPALSVLISLIFVSTLDDFQNENYTSIYNVNQCTWL